MTFRRGVSHAARFAPDGHTVIYSGHYDIREPRLFSTRPESPESAPLALPNAQLESISRSGDLALVLHPFGERILARAPLAGGSVREILENVGWADWAPDGKSLAVVRMVNGKARLEFPIGKVLFESSGFIDFPRLSPKADRVAFFDHPTAGDGSVVVVDLARKKTNLSEGWSTSTGLFWRPNGEEVWYSAGRSGADVDIRAVTLSGRDRLVYRAPMLVELFDVSPSGQVLFAKTTLFAVTRGLTAGETTERDLSWLDNSVVNDISPDGKTLVFTDLGSGAGPNSAVGLRKMDGSPTVRLGDGSSPVLSPDGKWVLAYLPHPEPAQLVLHPTGPGESRVLTHDSINHMAGAAWLPDGKRIIFPGNEPGHGARLFIQDLTGGAPRPILREGIWSGSSIFPSPDGKTVAFCCSAEKQALLFVDGESRAPSRVLARASR